MADPVMRIKLANSLTDILSVCKIDRVLSSPSRDESTGVAKPPRSFDVKECRINDFDPIEREEIFALFETNMKEEYVKNWGWNPTKERNEHFHPMNRFICLYERPIESVGKKDEGEARTPSASTETVFQTGDTNKKRPIAGYAIFRFEWDDDEEPEYPVLYCYELQVSEQAQGNGIGRWLMSTIVKISEKLHMWKVLLTCFTSNTKALQFYKNIGFDTDANSPLAMGDSSCQYEILSDKPHLR